MTETSEAVRNEPTQMT